MVSIARESEAVQNRLLALAAAIGWILLLASQASAQDEFLAPPPERPLVETESPSSSNPINPVPLSGGYEGSSGNTPIIVTPQGETSGGSGSPAVIVVPSGGEDGVNVLVPATPSIGKESSGDNTVIYGAPYGGTEVDRGNTRISVTPSDAGGSSSSDTPAVTTDPGAVTSSPGTETATEKEGKTGAKMESPSGVSKTPDDGDTLITVSPSEEESASDSGSKHSVDAWLNNQRAIRLREESAGRLDSDFLDYENFGTIQSDTNSNVNRNADSPDLDQTIDALGRLISATSEENLAPQEPEVCIANDVAGDLEKKLESERERRRKKQKEIEEALEKERQRLAREKQLQKERKAREKAIKAARKLAKKRAKLARERARLEAERDRIEAERDALEAERRLALEQEQKMRRGPPPDPNCRGEACRNWRDYGREVSDRRNQNMRDQQTFEGEVREYQSDQRSFAQENEAYEDALNAMLKKGSDEERADYRRKMNIKEHSRLRERQQSIQDRRAQLKSKNEDGTLTRSEAREYERLTNEFNALDKEFGNAIAGTDVFQKEANKIRLELEEAGIMTFDEAAMMSPEHLDERIAVLDQAVTDIKEAGERLSGRVGHQPDAERHADAITAYEKAQAEVDKLDEEKRRRRAALPSSYPDRSAELREARAELAEMEPDRSERQIREAQEKVRQLRPDRDLHTKAYRDALAELNALLAPPTATWKEKNEAREKVARLERAQDRHDWGGMALDRQAGAGMEDQFAEANRQLANAGTLAMAAQEQQDTSAFNRGLDLVDSQGRIDRGKVDARSKEIDSLVGDFARHSADLEDNERRFATLMPGLDGSPSVAQRGGLLPFEIGESLDKTAAGLTAARTGRDEAAMALSALGVRDLKLGDKPSCTVTTPFAKAHFAAKNRARDAAIVKARTKNSEQAQQVKQAKQYSAPGCATAANNQCPSARAVSGGLQGEGGSGKRQLAQLSGHAGGGSNSSRRLSADEFLEVQDATESHQTNKRLSEVNGRIGWYNEQLASAPEGSETEYTLETQRANYLTEKEELETRLAGLQDKREQTREVMAGNVGVAVKPLSLKSAPAPDPDPKADKEADKEAAAANTARLEREILTAEQVIYLIETDLANTPPDTPKARGLMAQLEVQKGHYERAVAELDGLPTADVDPAAGIATRSELQNGVKELTKAIDTLDIQLGSKPPGDEANAIAEQRDLYVRNRAEVLDQIALKPGGRAELPPARAPPGAPLDVPKRPTIDAAELEVVDQKQGELAVIGEVLGDLSAQGESLNQQIAVAPAGSNAQRVLIETRAELEQNIERVDQVYRAKRAELEVALENAAPPKDPVLSTSRGQARLDEIKTIVHAILVDLEALPKNSPMIAKLKVQVSVLADEYELTEESLRLRRLLPEILNPASYEIVLEQETRPSKDTASTATNKLDKLGLFLADPPEDFQWSEMDHDARMKWFNGNVPYWSELSVYDQLKVFPVIELAEALDELREEEKRLRAFAASPQGMRTIPDALEARGNYLKDLQRRDKELRELSWLNKEEKAELKSNRQRMLDEAFLLRNDVTARLGALHSYADAREQALRLGWAADPRARSAEIQRRLEAQAEVRARLELSIATADARANAIAAREAEIYRRIDAPTSSADAAEAREELENLRALRNYWSEVDARNISAARKTADEMRRDVAGKGALAKLHELGDESVNEDRVLGFIAASERFETEKTAVEASVRSGITALDLTDPDFDAAASALELYDEAADAITAGLVSKAAAGGLLFGVVKGTATALWDLGVLINFTIPHTIHESIAILLGVEDKTTGTENLDALNSASDVALVDLAVQFALMYGEKVVNGERKIMRSLETGSITDAASGGYEIGQVIGEIFIDPIDVLILGGGKISKLLRASSKVTEAAKVADKTADAAVVAKRANEAARAADAARTLPPETAPVPVTKAGAAAKADAAYAGIDAQLGTNFSGPSAGAGKPPGRTPTEVLAAVDLPGAPPTAGLGAAAKIEITGPPIKATHMGELPPGALMVTPSPPGKFVKPQPTCSSVCVLSSLEATLWQRGIVRSMRDIEALRRFAQDWFGFRRGAGGGLTIDGASAYLKAHKVPHTQPKSLGYTEMNKLLAADREIHVGIRTGPNTKHMVKIEAFAKGADGHWYVRLGDTDWNLPATMARVMRLDDFHAIRVADANIVIDFSNPNWIAAAREAAENVLEIGKLNLKYFEGTVPPQPHLNAFPPGTQVVPDAPGPAFGAPEDVAKAAKFDVDNPHIGSDDLWGPEFERALDTPPPKRTGPGETQVLADGPGGTAKSSGAGEASPRAPPVSARPPSSSLLPPLKGKSPPAKTPPSVAGDPPLPVVAEIGDGMIVLRHGDFELIIELLPVRVGEGSFTIVKAVKKNGELVTKLTEGGEKAAAKILDRYGEMIISKLSKWIRDNVLHTPNTVEEFNIVKANNSKYDGGSVRLVERAEHPTFWDSIQHSPRRMTAQEAEAFYNAQRALNDLEVPHVWLDNKSNNFGFDTAADGGLRVNAHDVGGIVPIKVVDGNVSEAQRIAREFQNAVSNPSPEWRRIYSESREAMLSARAEYAELLRQGASKAELKLAEKKYKLASMDFKDVPFEYRDFLMNEYGKHIDLDTLGVSSLDDVSFNPVNGFQYPRQGALLAADGDPAMFKTILEIFASAD